MKLKSLFLLSVLLFPLTAFSSGTNYAKIRQINYNATADFQFYLAEGGWQVTDSSGVLCTPTYVQVTNSVLGRDKILSIALAARYAGVEVRFQGECSSNPAYFNATYIITR